MTIQPTPRRGSDGKFHFLYVLYHPDTLEWYGGRHSTRNLKDGYKGSGNWALQWKQIAPDLLVMEPIEFFPNVESLKAAEATWITLETIADSYCRNEQEGGHGLTSASAKALHARPGYTASLGKLIQKALQDPVVNRRLRDGQVRGWAQYREQRVAAIRASITPELCALRSTNSREVGARPDVKEKRSRSLKATLAAPEKRQRKSEVTTEQWAREGAKEQHGAKTAERHHQNRAAKYGLDPNDVEAVNAAHAAHKAELNRKHCATFQERNQGPDLRAANREKTARYRARKKAAALAALAVNADEGLLLSGIGAPTASPMAVG